MSWNILEIGTRAAVRQAIENNPYLPQSVKNLVSETIHEKVPDHSSAMNGIRVEGYGHLNDNDGSSLGNVGKLEIIPVKLTLCTAGSGVAGCDSQQPAKMPEPTPPPADPEPSATTTA